MTFLVYQGLKTPTFILAVPAQKHRWFVRWKREGKTGTEAAVWKGHDFCFHSSLKGRGMIQSLKGSWKTKLLKLEGWPQPKIPVSPQTIFSLVLILKHQFLSMKFTCMCGYLPLAILSHHPLVFVSISRSKSVSQKTTVITSVWLTPVEGQWEDRRAQKDHFLMKFFMNS